MEWGNTEKNWVKSHLCGQCRNPLPHSSNYSLQPVRAPYVPTVSTWTRPLDWSHMYWRWYSVYSSLIYLNDTERQRSSQCMNRIALFPWLSAEWKRGRKKKLKARTMIWGYENMFYTCALNKRQSNRISDLEELGSWDCGVELGKTEW